MKAFTLYAAVLSLVLPMVTTAVAAPSPTTNREVDQLMRALGTSHCEFHRNGCWHDSAQAQAHLRKKYAWLRKRDMVDNAEQFIELAGSKSSLGGRAYQGALSRSASDGVCGVVARPAGTAQAYSPITLTR
ncbi:MAG: DUF5329 family protein [Lysobacter sp.]